MSTKNRKYMYVTIPMRVQHEGFQGYVRKIRISAICPKCGGPRGKVFSHDMRSYDGSRYVRCDGWKNPCGHVDYYKDVAKEYFESKKNKKVNK